MPHMELSHRWQKALLWAFTGYDSDGKPKVSSVPVEIDVRWVSRKSEVSDPEGNVISLDATAVVDREIRIGSIMWLGSEEQWYGSGSGSGSAGEDTELMEVKTTKETPDLRRRVERRTVGLAKHRDTFPNFG